MSPQCQKVSGTLSTYFTAAGLRKNIQWHKAQNYSNYSEPLKDRASEFFPIFWFRFKLYRSKEVKPLQHDRASRWIVYILHICFLNWSCHNTIFFIGRALSNSWPSQSNIDTVSISFRLKNMLFYRRVREHPLLLTVQFHFGVRDSIDTLSYIFTTLNLQGALEDLPVFIFMEL